MALTPLRRIALEHIRGAQGRIARLAFRTPLLEMEAGSERHGRARRPHPSRTTSSEERRVWLKLECLQSIGSFKVRGAANALALEERSRLEDGVYTGSAGNMAQGVALAARRLGVPCRVIVPDTAPRAKLDAISRLGATAIPLPFDEWWQVLSGGGHPDEKGHFVHPVSDPAVIAGNGTIGIEIAEDLPDVGAVVVPYGGGGLACGIAAALRELAPRVPVYAAEVETAAPFAAALEAGRPVTVRHRHSLVDGIGSTRVLDEMWPLARDSLAGSLVVSVDQVRAAIRLLARRARVVAEGAGAAAVAAALWGGVAADREAAMATLAGRGAAGTTRTGAVGRGRVVAVVSGGNIDAQLFREAVQGP